MRQLCLLAVLLASAARAADAPVSRIPGVFPVYDRPEGWLVLPKVRDGAGKGTRLLVIGSRGADVFSVARSTMAWGAACEGKRRARASGRLVLPSERARSVGTPVIAIALKARAALDPSKALFRPLANAVSEESYSLRAGPIRKAVLEEAKSGEFQFAPEDGGGALFAEQPSIEKISMKIDFEAPLEVPGLGRAVVLVEQSEISRSSRRCLRIFVGGEPVGKCAEMPRELMAETRALEFVAYYPRRGGAPFVLSFTRTEPLWGHERWGFQVTGGGPRVFLRDALDPKCRAGF